jgi:PAS domain S-box-containing protein
MDKQYSFDNSPMPQIIIDPFKDSIDKINPAAALLFWGTQQSLSGCRFSDFFRANLFNLIAFTQAVLEKGQYWSSDLSIIDPISDESRNLEISAGTVGDDPSYRLHLYVQDIHEIDRKRAASIAQKHYLSGLDHWKRVERFFQEVERDNQLILNAAGEGIYGVDAKGCTTFVNPVAVKFLGWTADELAGKEIHPIIHHSHVHGEGYDKVNCPIYAAFKDGAVHRVVDEVFWRKDGTSMPVEYTSTPIKDNGVLVGAVVVFRDVTQRKKAQQSLLEALAEVENLKQKLEEENAYLQEEILVNHNHHEIVGSSLAVQKVIKQISLVGPTDASVLVTGESGTGKELIARAIHEASQRSQRPLIKVNCAAIPRDIFESEFFGHVKGAFTGASSDRLGRFELADGGTLFLDEIGELPYELQGKLLRVLQEQQFERVGDTKTKTVDVRVIAATNQSLPYRVDEKLFRQDLYFRLNVFPIELPALRERPEDIPVLAMHVLEKTKRKFNRPDITISVSQMNQLMAYPWPGNVRELQNVIERQVIVAAENNIVFDGLMPPGSSTPVSHIAEIAVPTVITESERKSQDRARITTALEQCNGKVFGQGGAAELLQVKATTLASRIKKFGIDVRDYKKS